MSFFSRKWVPVEKPSLALDWDREQSAMCWAGLFGCDVELRMEAWAF